MDMSNQLAPFGAITNVTGLCFVILRSRGNGLGWVLTDDGSVVCWDGWYTEGSNQDLEDLGTLLADGETDPDEVRIKNNRQAWEAGRRALVPLTESGLASVRSRLKGDHPRGWGPKSFAHNDGYRNGVQVVGVLSLGEKSDLLSLASI